MPAISWASTAVICAVSSGSVTRMILSWSQKDPTSNDTKLAVTLFLYAAWIFLGDFFVFDALGFFGVTRFLGNWIFTC